MPHITNQDVHCGAKTLYMRIDTEGISDYNYKQ